ncbi:YlqD family protein [Dehalobacter sp. TBBPA1]|uniref:YlqD family protein n=1 Tax=Dehalobacter sp. TBBPA1 TaxID=3235037 RepID=UPI0034A52504
MESIKIFREITLKQIVTEESKERTRKQLREQMVALNDEKTEFEENKNKMLTEFSLKGAEATQLNQIRQQFDSQGTKFHVGMDEIRMNMVSIDELKSGEEIVIGSVEGPYELKVGDKLETATKAEIVFKDGIVVEIRQ